MLINFSNHPLSTWSKEQIEASKEYGEIMDIQFPIVDPEASYEDISNLAEHYVSKILSCSAENRITVHVMGEMTFVFLVVTLLKDKGIECIASTTDRNTEMISNSSKISDFHFVRFRKY